MAAGKNTGVRLRRAGIGSALAILAYKTIKSKFDEDRKKPKVKKTMVRKRKSR